MTTDSANLPDAAKMSPKVSAASRRHVLGLGVLGAVTLAGCSTGQRTEPAGSTGPARAAATSAPSPTDRRTTTDGAGTTASPPIDRPRPEFLSPGPDIVHGTSGRPEVALTFHGQGPSQITRAVARICHRATVRITVFAVGTWVAADPALVRELAADGHEIGNHTWSHRTMPSLDPATARLEVARGAQALTAALGTRGPWFRPSGTHESTPVIRAAANAAGYGRCVSYDVDPLDYRDPGARAVRAAVARDARAGSIVSLHLGHEGTAEALPGILADLAARGLRPVTMSGLLRA